MLPGFLCFAGRAEGGAARLAPLAALFQGEVGTMRVLVTGASGYLGGALGPAVTAAGDTYRGLVRGAPAGTATVSGDVVTGRGLEAACDGCEGVIHLVGALHATPTDLEALHVHGTENLLRAAERAGVRHVVYVSACGARLDGTPYQRSKAQAEQAVRSAPLTHTILRPTVVFGPGGPGPSFVRQLAGILRASPVMPIFGDGRYLLQPVASTNVADGCVRSLTTPSARNRTYEVGGPERLPYLEVLARIAAAHGRAFRPLPIPLGLVRAGLPLLQRLPGFPLHSEELTMLVEGNVCDAESYFLDLGLQPVAFQGR